ncbi:MAG: hypothetical protein SGPRY_008364, partial [Prymnesium sp.]
EAMGAAVALLQAASAAEVSAVKEDAAQQQAGLAVSYEEAVSLRVALGEKEEALASATKEMEVKASEAKGAIARLEDTRGVLAEREEELASTLQGAFEQKAAVVRRAVSEAKAAKAMAASLVAAQEEKLALEGMVREVEEERRRVEEEVVLATSRLEETEAARARCESASLEASQRAAAARAEGVVLRESLVASERMRGEAESRVEEMRRALHMANVAIALAAARGEAEVVAAREAWRMEAGRMEERVAAAQREKKLALGEAASIKSTIVEVSHSSPKKAAQLLKHLVSDEALGRDDVIEEAMIGWQPMQNSVQTSSGPLLLLKMKPAYGTA